MTIIAHQLKTIESNTKWPFLGIPGLTSDAVNHHFPASTETIKVYIHRGRNNTRSNSKTITQIINAGMNMTPLPDHIPPCEIFCSVVLANVFDGTVYSDLTGKFHVRSYKSNQYVFLTYVYDANEIIFRPLKSRIKDLMI